MTEKNDESKGVLTVMQKQEESVFKVHEFDLASLRPCFVASIIGPDGNQCRKLWQNWMGKLNHTSPVFAAGHDEWVKQSKAFFGTVDGDEFDLARYVHKLKQGGIISSELPVTCVTVDGSPNVTSLHELYVNNYSYNSVFFHLSDGQKDCHDEFADVIVLFAPETDDDKADLFIRFGCLFDSKRQFTHILDTITKDGDKAMVIVQGKRKLEESVFWCKV